MATHDGAAAGMISPTLREMKGQAEDGTYLSYEDAKLVARKQDIEGRLAEAERPLVTKEVFMDYLRVDMDQEDSCLSLPFAMGFLFVFVMVVNIHETIDVVYDLHSSIKGDIEAMAWDDGLKSFEDVTNAVDFDVSGTRHRSGPL